MRWGHITGASIGLLGLSLSAAGIAGATSPIGLALVAIGLIIGAIGIALGFAATKLVSTATMVWLNRCYIGRQYDTQLTPFASIEQEQSSLDLLSQGVAIELSWEEHTATYVRGDTGPLGERVNRKQVRIKARIPNLSKMQFGLKMETISIVRPEEIFNDNFDKDDGSLIFYGKDGERSNASEVSVYDISSTEDVYTMERTLYLSEDESITGAKLDVVFQDARTRPLRYLDVFKLEFN